MRFIVLIQFYIFLVNFSLAQKETNQWFVSFNHLIDFNSGNPVVTNLPDSFDIDESLSCISDENGQLIFITDGEDVVDANCQPVPNGNSITSYFTMSTTQGSIILPVPDTSNQYFIFSITWGSARRLLSYSLFEKNATFPNGSIVYKNVHLIIDSLTEKMTAAKHCNGKDYWLIVQRFCDVIDFHDNTVYYNMEFLSFLVTSNGVSPFPVRSKIHTRGQTVGQMKLNNAGDVLVTGGIDYFTLFNFDNSSGTFSLKEEIYLNNSVPLYGVEFSPNDKLLYLNEIQYDLTTGVTTKLLDYSSPSQMQRAVDGKIYRNHWPSTVNAKTAGKNFFYPNSGNFSLDSPIPFPIRFSRIKYPNIPGINCQYEEVLSFTDTNFSLAMPNFPSFHFNHSPSDFKFKGHCSTDNYSFELISNESFDSVVWHFPEQTLTGNPVSYNFGTSGIYSVACTVYNNGISNSSSQCVEVCGENDFTLPETIDLCDYDSYSINLVNPCTQQFQWSDGNNSPVFSPTETGEYSLIYTNECGIYYDTVQVIEGDECRIIAEIPNVITTNSDGINELFSVKVRNVKTVKYSFFNRWGNELHHDEIDVAPSNYFSLSSINLWNGYSSVNTKVLDGVYYYKIEFTNLKDKISIKNGFFQVISN